MHVYAHPPLIGKDGTSVNVTLSHNDRKISLCCDDSCGKLDRLARSDLRLLNGKEDVTALVMGVDKEDICPAFGDDLKKALEWLLAGGG